MERTVRLQRPAGLLERDVGRDNFDYVEFGPYVVYNTHPVNLALCLLVGILRDFSQRLANTLHVPCYVVNR